MPVGLRSVGGVTNPLPLLSVQVAFASTPLAQPPVWTDITSYVRRVKIQRGRQHRLQQFQPGRLSLLLDGRNRALDPTNSSGPYAPNVDINKRVRVQAQWNILTAAQGGATVTGGWTAGANTTVSYVGGNLRLTSTAAGAMSAFTPAGTAGFAVYPGQQYSGMGSAKAVAVSQSVTASMLFYDATGALLATIAGAVVSDVTSGFTQARVDAQAPATAAFAALRMDVQSTAGASELHDFQRLAVIPQPGVVAWVAGGPQPLFVGFADSWVPMWPDNVNADVTMSATDALRIFATDRLTSGSYASTVKADGAKAFYRFGDAAGSTQAADSSTAGTSPGTYRPGVTLGQPGPTLVDATTAALFGSNNYMTVLFGAQLSGTAGFALELWFQTSATALQIIYMQYPPGDPSNPGHLVTLEMYINANGAGVVTFGCNDNPPDFPFINSATGFNDGKWHQAVATRSANGLLGSLYVDGVLQGTVTTTARDFAYYQQTLWGNTLANAASLTLANGATYPTVLTAAQVLNHYTLGLTGFPLQDSGARIAAILDTLSWPSVDRNIAIGNTTVQRPSSSLTTTSVLSYAQAVEKAEDGALFVDASGRVTFRNRQYPLIPPNNAPLTTFGDASTGEVTVKPSPVFSLDTVDLYNQAVESRLGGTVQQYTDTASVIKYGVTNVLQESGLLMTTDVEAQARAQWKVSHYSNSKLRIRSVTMDALGDPVSRIPVAMSREITDRVTVNRRPPGGGALFTQDSIIEGVSMEISPAGKWDVTYALSPAETTMYWLLGDVTYGILGTSTRCGY